jgi:hypothetical protein
MDWLQATRHAIGHACKATHIIAEAVALTCGLTEHGGGMHCDTHLGLWWCAAPALALSS